MANNTVRNIRPSGGACGTHFTPFSEFPEPARSRRQQNFERIQERLAEEFTGIRSGGGLVGGLFPVAPTGISLAPVLDAANALRDALTEAQWQQAGFAVDDDRTWRSWHNMHTFLIRHGLPLHSLGGPQRDAVLRLIEASSSAAGYETARNVMKLNEHAGEITGRPEDYTEWYYWISIFGEPSATEPWGWQIDGHHLIINCFIYGDQMVMTPDFRGSEPVFAEFGKFAGTRVFHDEESQGLAFMEALSEKQQRDAVIGTQMPRDVFATAQMDNLSLDYAGIRYDGLASAQQKRLLDLIELYAHRIRPGHAEVRMDEVKRHLAQTHFGWIGEHGKESPFYYRIHSPVILIEFDHQAGQIWDNTEPTRDHIHTVVRTPNGNDYGRDLLRQHYEQHDHSHPNTDHRRGLT